MTGRHLLDTNHLSEAIRPVSPLRDRILDEIRKGSVFGTCVPVLCELEVGLDLAHRRVEYRRELRWLLRRVRIWPLERDLPTLYAEIFADLRGRGRVFSQVDIMLAALCRQMNLTLLTRDRDFEALPDLRVENWLA